MWCYTIRVRNLSRMTPASNSEGGMSMSLLINLFCFRTLLCFVKRHDITYLYHVCHVILRIGRSDDAKRVVSLEINFATAISECTRNSNYVLCKHLFRFFYLQHTLSSLRWQSIRSSLEGKMWGRGCFIFCYYSGFLFFFVERRGRKDAGRSRVSTFLRWSYSTAANRKFPFTLIGLGFPGGFKD